MFSGELTPINGPSDVGGQCPAPTYTYAQGEKEFCCCADGCCWTRCLMSTPPSDCLQGIPNSQWIYSEELGYYQAFRRRCETVNGKVCQFPFRYKGTTYYQCTKDYSENENPWCATEIDQDTGDVILGQWGDCNNVCPSADSGEKFL